MAPPYPERPIAEIARKRGRGSHMPTYTVTVRRTVHYEALITVDAEDAENAKVDAADISGSMDLDEFDPVDERDTVEQVIEED